jgi:hypothetical protein
MPLRRLGLVDAGQAATGQTDLEFLPWKGAVSDALARYVEQQPSAGDLARVEACQVSPLEYLENPHLTIKALESEKTLMFLDCMKAIGELLDEETAWVFDPGGKPCPPRNVVRRRHLRPCLD